MKLTILGAAGVRTPMIVEEIIRRQDVLGIDELCLMDIDGTRLDLIASVTTDLENSPETRFRITRTTDSARALDGADFVITTFRVGGSESRIIDERVALKLGYLGQETTGPGGFAMGIRSIPVLLAYVEQMKRLCPDAWLINFANPSGMMAEAVHRVGGWQRCVGICDAPSEMLKVISLFSGLPENLLHLDYFGLNHLGWIRSVKLDDQDILPKIIRGLRDLGGIPGFDMDVDLVTSLGMLPNYYLRYYYHARQTLEEIRALPETRGEEVHRLNQGLFRALQSARTEENPERLKQVYRDYLIARQMGHVDNQLPEPSSAGADLLAEMGGMGYATLALDLIEALVGGEPRTLVVNIPNRGSLPQMKAGSVVEIPARISRDRVEPFPVGEIPVHCLGLMQSVKAYEEMTIDAAAESSREKAVIALTWHPLVQDYQGARNLVDGYLREHGDYFPRLR